MLSIFVIGISIGLLLFLLAAGLTLIFGLLGIINFAHGAFYMLGAYVGYQVLKSTGQFWIALTLTPVLMLIAGLVLERYILRPLYSRPHAQQLVVTFGLILVLQEAVRMIWGLDYLRVNAPTALSGTTTIAGSVIGNYRLFVCFVGAIVAFALLYALERTALGATIRAAADKPKMLECLGGNVNNVRMWTLGAGTGLAAFAGALAAPLVPIDSSMAVTIIVDCFVVVVIGGLGNVRGAIFAALCLGLVRAFGQQFAPEYIDAVTYVLLILTLVLRPTGIFNRQTRTA
jgi:branched-chain amino acid transport system permease protein